jgi:membrane-associated protease RseP (regulator of RpoE activity)
MTDTIPDTELTASDVDRLVQRRNLTKLLVSLGLLLGLAGLTGAFSTITVIVAFIAMIMLHELGHFLTAKAAGMKVTEYFLGFGPKLWSVRKGETEYGVKALPLGGYVRIIGMHNLEQVDPADESRTYRAQPYWRRMSVALAGSAMHFIIALVLLFALFTAVGVPDQSRLVIREIYGLRNGPSPAQAAGFKVGDEVISIDGARVTSFQDLSKQVQPNPGEPIRFTVRRDGDLVDLTAVPADLSKVEVAVRPGEPPINRPAKPTGFLGVGGGAAFTKEGPVSAIARSGEEFGLIAKGSVGALVGFFRPDRLVDYGRLLSEPKSQGGASATEDESNRFLSPVGFVRVAGQAADSGMRNVLTLLVLINIFVGLFNLVPLLPLDGGHVAIATYERIRSRKNRPYRADVSKLLPLTYAVVVLLVTLAATSLWLDIFKPLANPFE